MRPRRDALSTQIDQLRWRMREDGKIDDIETPGGDLSATKAFYSEV